MKQVEPSAAGRRNLRGAWWIAAAVAVFFVAVAWVQLREVAAHRSEPRVGDGQDPATYGYALDDLQLDRRWLAATMPKDNLEPLDHPSLLTPAQVDSLNGAERGKYLVPEDRVIGLSINGVARAYPIRVMNWHEVANDTLGGVAVAVTWHPLSGSVVALDRGEQMFSVSGLVWNSHHLLHDRSPAESLWLPLEARAVLGPRTGEQLAIIPSAVTTWGEWRQAFPATTVPRPVSELKPAYKRDPYGNYWSGDIVRYPVDEAATLAGGGGLKDQLPVAPVDRGDGLIWADRHAFHFCLTAMGLMPR